MADIGHNGGPALAQRNFKKRWAAALFAHPQKPTGAVALGFKLYMEMDSHGRGAVISDREFSESCGVSERACQNFKRWLIVEEFVHIHVKGVKGRPNEFIACIPGDGLPAPRAVNHTGLPAPISGKTDVDRHPLPANEPTFTAPDAGNPVLPAPDAGNPKNSSRAAKDNNIYNNINNLTSKLPPLQEPARVTAAEYDGEFPALNGTAINMVRFISEHAMVDERTAREMLRNNIKAFGSDEMLEAYSVTMAEMTSSVVATPYKYLIGCAKQAKAQNAKPARSGRPKNSELYSADHIQKRLEAMEREGKL